MIDNTTLDRWLAQTACLDRMDKHHLSDPAVALAVADSVRVLVANVKRLQRYERAIQSLASQIVCHPPTPEEMVNQILGEKP